MINSYRKLLIHVTLFVFVFVSVQGCYTGCATCTGSGSNQCTTCNSNYYYESSNNLCVACDPTCPICSGPMVGDCVSCGAGYYHLIPSYSCVTCKNGYTSGNICYFCDPSCLTCSGPDPSECLSCRDSTYSLSSNNSCVASNTANVQAAEAVGTTSKVVFISAAASGAISFLHSKGNSATLMNMLQIMARITYMKLIDVNYLTPLAKFYSYTELGQLGLPNIFNKMKDTTTTSNRRILAQSTSNDVNSSSNLFLLDAQGNVTFNSYFGYSFGQIFLDDYGGIVFFSCIIFVLYLTVRLVSKCFKDENTKIKSLLTKLAQALERSIITTLLVSRYMYLCSSLIFNYVFHPLNGVYEQVSFGFAIFYTILLIFIFGLAICAGFYHSRESKARLKPIRPMLDILALLLQQYRSIRVIGRFFTFWTLLSDLMRVLVLLLLYKWPVAQLIILIILSLITVILSLPNSVFKKTASKILTIGTEVGFMIMSILFLVMHFLQNIETSDADNILLIMSWSGVGVNISIILFQLIIEIVEFFRLRKEKKRQEQQQRAIQNLNQLENPSGQIEQSDNIDDSHNPQLIQMLDVNEMESAARRLNEPEVGVVNRSRSRTRLTVIDDVNSSQQIQLQNSPHWELSFEQSNRIKIAQIVKRYYKIDIFEDDQPIDLNVNQDLMIRVTSIHRKDLHSSFGITHYRLCNIICSLKILDEVNFLDTIDSKTFKTIIKPVGPLEIEDSPEACGFYGRILKSLQGRLKLKQINRKYYRDDAAVKDVDETFASVENFPINSNTHDYPLDPALRIGEKPFEFGTKSLSHNNKQDMEEKKSEGESGNGDSKNKTILEKGTIYAVENE